ncbi:nucleoid occlusion protein [Risungbinella massiliensis]|uniref:nucleoid occlusion protein n=1 Tax=Risungbinella massiliensis TaxID=1329796 RepID=UPI0005CB8CE4|nr:nucleoid occlusion protein [Risungbinella massiliensis]
MRDSLGRWFGIAEKNLEQVRNIPVSDVDPSPYQPRTIFEDDKLEELCQTISTHGVIQPIIVRTVGKRYELIAGERRLRAVKLLNLIEIPAIVRELSDEEASTAALIENLQREGLTSIEEAHAYQKLIELQSLTQEGLAKRLGKGQSTIANKLRLLQLPIVIQEALQKRAISERHARALLILKEEQQLFILEEILTKDLNVKQTEERVKKFLLQEEELAEENSLTKQQRKAVSRDFRIAMNTIRQSIDMVKQTGMEVTAAERELDDCVEVVIRITKKEQRKD